MGSDKNKKARGKPGYFAAQFHRTTTNKLRREKARTKKFARLAATA